MSTLGAIADDFTGATDLATNLAKRGFQVVVVPEDGLDAVGFDDASFEAVVVALKTRTASPDSAIADSLRALDFLKGLGCERFYDKYCSTFDSTDAGNIGPVLDALSNQLDAFTVVVVPSFPDNGRTVTSGILSVNGELLENSSMRHHPLTPMTKSRVSDILRPQTSATISEIHADVVDSGASALTAALASAAPGYVVVDAATDAQLSVIAEATSSAVLVSGGSGLALGLTPTTAGSAQTMVPTSGRRLVLSGSASTATRGQVNHARSRMPSLKIDVAALIADADATLASTLAWLGAQDHGEPALIYAVDSLADLDDSPAGASERVEWLLGQVAIAAVQRLGFTRIIVAGGETSGSVVKSLGLQRLVIGAEIAPGVCWASGVTADRIELNIALKSGNFGTEQMFTDAWKVLGA